MNKHVYFNRAQQEIIAVDAHTSIIVAGRRFGKTHGVIGPKLLRMVQGMPGGSIGIVVPTYKRGLMNTLPGTLKALESWGYKRGREWFIGRKPPKEMNFAKPLIEPLDYSYVLSFYNGTVGYLISQDVAGSANGLTLDGLIGDEARILSHDQLKEEVFPANGGTKAHFGHRYDHHSMMFVSDMPVGKKGSWFLNYKNECDPAQIEAIRGLIYEIWKQKQRYNNFVANGTPPPSYLKGHIRDLCTMLAKLRRMSVFYKEYSSIENVEILGKDYIRQMKRDLPPLTFRASIMCMPIGLSSDGFYGNMKDRHKYSMSDISYLESLDYDFDRIDNDSSLTDADVIKDRPICIGMDYNANINWIVAGQPYKNRLNVIKSFYVKYDRKIPELIDDFCHYYRHHRCKEIIYYYDTTALGSNYAVNDQDFRQVVIDGFERNGWSVLDVKIGQPMRHMEKHLIINEQFAGRRNLEPYFNEQNNEDLLLAIAATGVYNGKKDKRGEKLDETEEDPLELRTDGTDAFDTLTLGCELFPKNETFADSFISVIM